MAQFTHIYCPWTLQSLDRVLVFAATSSPAWRLLALCSVLGEFRNLQMRVSSSCQHLVQEMIPRASDLFWAQVIWAHGVPLVLFWVVLWSHAPVFCFGGQLSARPPFAVFPSCVVSPSLNPGCWGKFVRLLGPQREVPGSHSSTPLHLRCVDAESFQHICTPQTLVFDHPNDQNLEI